MFTSRKLLVVAENHNKIPNTSQLSRYYVLFKFIVFYCNKLF